MLHDRLYFRVAGVARAFVLVALAVPILWSRDTPALVAILTIGSVWTVATILDLRPWVPVGVLTAGEGLLVGAVCGSAMDSSLAVLGALTVPPFVAGIYRGLWGVAVALCAELTTLVAAVLLLAAGLTPDQGYAAFSWSVIGLGLGLIGTFLHTALLDRTDPLASYHYAQSLLRRLIDISDGLDGGLDPVTMGGGILSTVRDELPTSVMVLYVPRGDTLTPLVTRSIGNPGELSRCEDLAVRSWVECSPIHDGRAFAFPLTDGDGVTAVVSAVLPPGAEPAQLGAEERLRQLMNKLRPSAVHLDTALLFAAFRDAATAEERRRLAREMHDGVAQDIASLGYLADALAATATTDQQRERIAQLRERISAIVGEIRRSLVNLRTSVGASESLGAAIASIARNLSEVSGVAIHVTADERTDRLRPEVEAELFRIAQEAMNNAVKHARASAIEVHCQVRAPAAQITIVDDGRGLQPQRRGSHGLEIMRERARLINGTLEISETPGGGLTVAVTIAGGGEHEPETEEVTIGSGTDTRTGA